jgi:hypothetical protein
MSIFQQLYDSEVNFEISCFLDGGFEVKLGDGLNGYASQTRVDSWDATSLRCGLKRSCTSRKASSPGRRWHRSKK